MGLGGFPGGIGGGGGYSPIDIVLRLQIANLMALSQLNQQLTQTQRLTTGAQRGMNGLTGSVGRGIGAFFVLRRAMQASNMMLRTGVESSAEWELALTKLGIATNETGSRLARLGDIAEDVVMKVGPLWGPDMLAGMRTLANTIGGTTERAAALADPMGKLISNIVTLSGGRMSAEGAGGMIGRVINLFGGKHARGTMELFQKSTGAFFPEDPSKLETTLRKIAPMANLGMSPEQIFMLASVAALAPTSARGGSDVRRFLDQVAGARGLLSKRGRSAREQAAMLSELGFLPGGHSALMPGGGPADFTRMLSFISGRTAGKTPEEVALAAQKAFPALLPRGFYLFLAANPDILKRIQERQATMKGIEDVFQTLRTTMTYSFSQLSNDIKQLLARIFTAPSSMLAAVARVAADAATVAVRDVRNVPALGSIAGFGASAFAGGATLSIAGMMLRGLGAFGGGLGAGGRLAAGALGFGGGALMFGGIISAIIVGGIEAYQHSARFRGAIHSFEGMLAHWEGVTQPQFHSAALRALEDTKKEIVNFFAKIPGFVRYAMDFWGHPAKTPTLDAWGNFKGMSGGDDAFPGFTWAPPPFKAHDKAVIGPEQPQPTAPPVAGRHTGTSNKATTSMAVERLFAHALRQAIQEGFAMPQGGPGGLHGAVPYTPGITQGF